MTPPAPQPLTFAVIGCGLIGKKRAAALTKISGVRLAYACDMVPARAEELARHSPGSKAVANYTEVMADSGVDAVIVSTVNSSLSSIALAAVHAGKHVLVEKPGALSSAALREVQGAANGAKVKVRIGYNHRFHPAFQKTREMVDAGALGPLLFLRARYGHGGRLGYDREWRANPKLSGGGELIDQGVHLIDLSSWFLGDFATIDGHACTSYWDMPVDDNAFLSLRTGSGQTAWLHVSCTEWKNLFSLEIYGRTGKLSVDGLGGSYGVEKVTYYRMLPEMGPPETTAWEFPRGDDSWAAETEAFVADITQGNDGSRSLSDGIRTLEIVESIYERSGFTTS
jgi:predicted dehydrogenase